MLQVKKKEGRNSTQGHELNKWIDNNTFFFKEKKKHILRKDLCFPIPRDVNMYLCFTRWAVQ